MELVILAVLGGFLLFLFIGAIKSFAVSSEVNSLKQEVLKLRRKISMLENRIGIHATPADNKSAEIQESARKRTTLEPPARPPAQETQSTATENVNTEPDTVQKDTHEEKKEFTSPATSVPRKVTFEDMMQTGESSAPAADATQPSRPRERKPAPRRKPRQKSKWAQQFEGMNWETLIGTYIVPRLGVLGITIAVFILLALAAQRFGPGFRVAIGYAISGTLFGIGRFTDHKYPTYARVVYGAGLAVAYFVTFATHYIPFARIFESPLPALGGMAVIIGIWAAIAQQRKSPTIAMLVTALGHFTIGLTSVTVDNPAPFAVLGILILSTGSAYFLLRNRWYYVAAVGMLASYANHFLLLINSEGAGTVPEFTIGITVLSAYFLIFASTELFAPETLRRKSVPGTVRSLFVTFNTGCYFVLGTILVENYEFTRDHHYVFHYSLAAALLTLSALYFLRRKEDPLYNTYFAKAVTVATLGLAVQFDGHTLTVALAIETIALLASSRRSGLVVTRAFAHIVGMLTFAHGTLTFLLFMRFMPYNDEAYATTLLQSIIPCIGLLLASQVYQRIDWSKSMRLGFELPKPIRTTFWKIDFYPEPADNAKDPKKPIGGLLFPYLYAIAGGILALSYTLRLITIDDRFNLYACVAVGMLTLAYILRSKPYAIVNILFTGAAFIATWHTMIDNSFTAVYVVGVLGTVLIALATEANFVPNRDALGFHRNAVAPFVFYGIAAWSIGLYMTHWFDGMNFLAGLLIGSILLSALNQVLHARAMATYATAYFIWASGGWLIESVGLFVEAPKLGTKENMIAIALIGVSVVGDRYYTLRKIPVVASILLSAGFVTATRFAGVHIDDAWYGFVLAVIAALYLGYGTLLRSKVPAVLALGGTAFAILTQLQWAYDSSREYALAPTVLGFIAVIALLITYERAARLRFSTMLGNGVDVITGTCVALAAALGVVMLERIPDLAAFYLTLSWSILALGYFAIAIATNEKNYRFAGLAILTLAILRVVFVDTRELEAVARVLAFGGLGAVLLGIGLGYVKAFGGGQPPTSETGGEENSSFDDEFDTRDSTIPSDNGDIGKTDR